jgi:hypothetical protein
MDQLYEISMKMLKDKHNIDTYPKEKFEYVYTNIFNSNINSNVNINNLNKQVLKKINEDYISSISNIKTNIEPNINLIVKEYISQREKPSISPSHYNDYINNSAIINPVNNNYKYINIDNNNNHSYNGKSFIINTFKNIFHINKQIVNKIYPSYLCIPSLIKNYTPYIIVAITENNNNNITYTFIPTIICDTWDIWKPVNDKYINVELNSNNWTISLYDHTNNLIDLQMFYIDILETLENDNSYQLKINSIYLFNIYDKIKIILNNGTNIDNIIIGIENDNYISIQKNNIKIEQFINSKICNFKHQISIIFNTFPK